jgi:hypothetical protein
MLAMWVQNPLTSVLTRDIQRRKAEKDKTMQMEVEI